MTESVGGPASGSAPHSPNLSITSLALALVALLVFGSAMIAAVVDVGTVGDVVLVVAAVAGVILGIGAVLTGVVARRRVQRGNAARGGVALAGIVLGAVTAVLPAIVLAGLAHLLYSSYEDFQQCISASGHPKYMCLKECPSLLDSLCRRQIEW